MTPGPHSWRGLVRWRVFNWSQFVLSLKTQYCLILNSESVSNRVSSKKRQKYLVFFFRWNMMNRFQTENVLIKKKVGGKKCTGHHYVCVHLEAPCRRCENLNLTTCRRPDPNPGLATFFSTQLPPWPPVCTDHITTGLGGGGGHTVLAAVRLFWPRCPQWALWWWQQWEQLHQQLQ